MACIVTFDSNSTTGVLTGSPSSSGIFEYVGYSPTVGGTYGAGGNFPTTTPIWGSSVNVSNVTPGFYKFLYKADLPPEDACYGEVEIIIPIIQGTYGVPEDLTINLCAGDGIRTIMDDLGGYLPDAVNPVTINLSGSGLSSPGYEPNGASLGDDTYDPSLETSFPVSRTFIFEYEINVPLGFSASSCDNCITKTVTLTYEVTDGFIPGTPANKAICNDGDL